MERLADQQLPERLLRQCACRYRLGNGPYIAQHVGAFSTWDIQGSYAGIKNLTLTAGIKNLFNRKPTDVITAGSYFQAGYDPTWYDVHGQTGYLSANYKF